MPPSDSFFFQVVHVEPVMHHSVTRNELLNIIFHVLLELQRQVTQMEVPLFVIPRNDFRPRTLLSVFTESTRRSHRRWRRWQRMTENLHTRFPQTSASVDRADNWNGTPLPSLEALPDICPRCAPPIRSQQVFVAGYAEILSHRANHAPATSLFRGFIHRFSLRCFYMPLSPTRT
jgi:hypothetical protein